ncbi:MAG: RHS repeat-associated core domain-containing protein [Coriobacteriia bacterium]|nr:RHS repeat-associated core domain-containing protein [Coriobacteriia bacterium]
MVVLHGHIDKKTSSQNSTQCTYTGGIWDACTGLYYLNARYYNPVDARFLTLDTARNGGDIRATLSLYGYCEGDPINATDPSGFSSTKWSRVLIARCAAPGAGGYGLIELGFVLAGGTALVSGGTSIGLSLGAAALDKISFGNAISLRLSVVRDSRKRARVTLESKPLVINLRGQTVFKSSMKARFTPEYSSNSRKPWIPISARDKSLVPNSNQWQVNVIEQRPTIPKNGSFKASWTVTNTKAVSVRVRFTFIGSPHSDTLDPKALTAVVPAR